MSGDETPIVFVSGLSGSGKSTAMAALEDLSFYCVDNLPVQLIDQFLHLCTHTSPPIERIALAIDAREAAFLQAFPGVLRQLRKRGTDVELIFLECTNEVLINRYRETRRVHPHSPEGSVEDGIERERRVLNDIVGLADQVFDTSTMTVHQLKSAIVRHILGESRPTVVNLTSFGFRYGAPQSVELLFDVRFLPNPHFEERLRPRTGHDREVAAYVLENDLGAALYQRLRDFLAFLLPLYDAEGKAYVTIGIGCTGGRHRSVTITDALAVDLRVGGREVNVEHRDVERET